MNERTEYKTVELDEAQKKAQRSRALGVGVALALFALVLYGASFAKLYGLNI